MKEREVVGFARTKTKHPFLLSDGFYFKNLSSPYTCINIHTLRSKNNNRNDDKDAGDDNHNAPALL